MGFGGKTESKTYFKIKDGHVVVTIKNENKDSDRSQALIQDAVKTELSQNGDWLDLYFKFFIGKMTGVTKRTGTFKSKDGKDRISVQWNVEFIDDNQDLFVWNCYYEHNLMQGFVNCLIDTVVKKIKLGYMKMWIYEKNDRTRLSLKNSQNPEVFNDEHRLSWHYDIDGKSPIGLPDMPSIDPIVGSDGQQIMDGQGNKQWDKKKRMVFIENAFKKVCEEHGIPFNIVDTTQQNGGQKEQQKQENTTPTVPVEEKQEIPETSFGNNAKAMQQADPPVAPEVNKLDFLDE